MDPGRIKMWILAGFLFRHPRVTYALRCSSPGVQVLTKRTEVSMFLGFVYLVGWLFFYFKTKYIWGRFCVWTNSAPSPTDLFRSTQAEKSAEGHNWLIKKAMVTHD